MATVTPTTSASTTTQPTGFTSSPSTTASTSSSPTTTTRTTMSSDKLWQHLSSTLELVHRRLADAPEIQLLVQSATLSCDRLRALVRTYEVLLPRLKALVARQRDELGSSATLLGQARRAYLQLHHRCETLQQSNMSRLDFSQSTAINTVGTQTDTVRPSKARGGNVGENVPAVAGRCGSGNVDLQYGHDEIHQHAGKGVGTSDPLLPESTLGSRIQELEAELQDVKGQLRDSITKMNFFRGTIRTHEARTASWRRRAEFQEKVNDKLRRVIETQEQLLDGRSSEAYCYRNKSNSTTFTTSRHDPPGAGSHSIDVLDSTSSDDEQDADGAICSKKDGDSDSGHSVYLLPQSCSSGSRPPRSPPSAHRHLGAHASSPAPRHSNGRLGTPGDSQLRQAASRRFEGTGTATDIYSISS
eukprot:INCI4075.3.p1 GENE.INCI4075.3~~INCI4075.3.p1  ORF type:complete len:468 (+),score=76.20 INCI4075.3:160-1404(+)